MRKLPPTRTASHKRAVQASNARLATLNAEQRADLDRKARARISKAGLEITRLLTVSSGHVTKADAELLQIRAWPCVMNSEYQSLFPTDPSFQEAAKRIGYSEALCALLAFARGHDCTLLRIHADGPVVPGLPVFDW